MATRAYRRSIAREYRPVFGRNWINTMAKIVLAMATTHGPQLHTTVEQWQLRVNADKARKHPFRNGLYSFDELVQMREAEGLDAKSSMDAQHKYHARCHAAMERLADKWEEV